jgi:hypothetical protein
VNEDEVVERPQRRRAERELRRRLADDADERHRLAERAAVARREAGLLQLAAR